MRKTTNKQKVLTGILSFEEFPTTQKRQRRMLFVGNARWHPHHSLGAGKADKLSTQLEHNTITKT